MKTEERHFVYLSIHSLKVAEANHNQRDEEPRP